MAYFDPSSFQKPRHVIIVKFFEKFDVVVDSQDSKEEDNLFILRLLNSDRKNYELPFWGYNIHTSLLRVVKGDSIVDELYRLVTSDLPNFYYERRGIQVPVKNVSCTERLK